MAKPTKQIPAFTESDKSRFFSKISTTPTKGGCLEWLACKNKDGYGLSKVGRETFLSHRVAYFIATGDNPGEFLIRHSCNNPPCCNTEHLSAGTHQDNVDDCVRAGRSAKGDNHGSCTHPESVARGEGNGSAKLTESQVIAIRSDTRVQKDIALDYGIAQSLISYIKNRQRWAHI